MAVRLPSPLVGGGHHDRGRSGPGELTGDFLVLDAATGRELYRFPTGGPSGGGIVSYVAKGKQYVAVMSGRPSPFWALDQGSPTAFVFALP